MWLVLCQIRIRVELRRKSLIKGGLKDLKKESFDWFPAKGTKAIRGVRIVKHLLTRQE